MKRRTIRSVGSAEWERLARMAGYRKAIHTDVPTQVMAVGWAQEIESPTDCTENITRYAAWIGGDHVEEHFIRQTGPLRTWDICH